MDLNLIRMIETVALFVLFVGLVYLLYGRRSDKAFQDAANLPFLGDDTSDIISNQEVTIQEVTNQEMVNQEMTNKKISVKKDTGVQQEHAVSSTENIKKSDRKGENHE